MSGMTRQGGVRTPNTQKKPERRPSHKSNGQLQQNPRRPLPGHTARSHRVREAFEDLLRLELRRNHLREHPYSIRQLKIRAAAQLQSLQSHFADFAREYGRLAPTSRSPLRRHISTWVELAAFVAQPEIVWLRHYLVSERRGRRARRGI